MTEVWLGFWQASWQGALAGLLLVAWRRSSNGFLFHLRYLLLWVVILRWLLPWVPEAPWRERAEHPPQPAWSRSSPQEPLRIPAVDFAPDFAAGSHRTPEPATGSARPAPAPDPVPWTRWLSAIWLAGAASILAGALARYARFRWRLRTARDLRGDPQVAAALEQAGRRLGLRSIPLPVRGWPGLTSPALAGFLRPCLLVPTERASWPAFALELVALHEVTHWKRGHLIQNWVLLLVQALHWYNPMAWLLVRALKEERELICDAAVLERLPGSARLRYGELLLSLGELRGPAAGPAATLIFSPKTLTKRRIRMIAQNRLPHRGVKTAAGLVAIAAASLLLTRAQDPLEDPPGTQAPRIGTEAEPFNSPPPESADRAFQMLVEKWEKELRSKVGVLKEREAAEALASELLLLEKRLHLEQQVAALGAELEGGPPSTADLERTLKRLSDELSRTAERLQRLQEKNLLPRERPTTAEVERLREALEPLQQRLERFEREVRRQRQLQEKNLLPGERPATPEVERLREALELLQELLQERLEQFQREARRQKQLLEKKPSTPKGPAASEAELLRQELELLQQQKPLQQRHEQYEQELKARLQSLQELDHSSRTPATAAPWVIDVESHQYALNGETVSEEELARRVQASKPGVVHIRASASVSFSKVKELLERLKGEGVARMTLELTPKAG